MIDSNVAVLQPESDDVMSPENPTNASDTVVVEQRQPVIVPRNSSLAGGTKNGRPVDPIALKSLNRPNVERVLWIEVEIFYLELFFPSPLLSPSRERGY